MENKGKIADTIRVFCLFEKQHEIEFFLNSTLAQTDIQRYLVIFSDSSKPTLNENLRFQNGFTIENFNVPRKITPKWKKKDFRVHMDKIFSNFPKASTRQNFFLDFSAQKVTRNFVEFVESSFEKELSNYKVRYSLFSLFLEKNLSKKLINQLALKYPFLCLKNTQVHPNFFYDSEGSYKFPSNIRDLYQPIQLLLEEFEKSSLDLDRLNRELFLLSTQNSVLESTLATFLAIDRDQSETIVSAPADIISLSHYRDLKQRYNEKSLMLSSVSHDLKSPIAAIQGFAELLRDGLAGEVTPEMKNHLEVIVSNSKRLSRMVDSLLEYERYDQIQIEQETFDLVDVINDAKMSVLPQMVQKDQEIHIYAPDALEMVGNRELVLRVLQNILDNAVKYSPPQKGKVELFAEEQTQKGRQVIIIKVKDNGFGFRENDLKRVFEPFSRFEPGLTSTGLGLSIVRKIVTLHGGTVEIFSPGRKKGTTVTIALPKI
ncbi:MAG: HAMP domain-containing histidine kinase [Candidatus Heimdallarchaeota archaeon]|nr:MAG: HAMP domain-containing histidine kinase [Candidatus Heimdallarchaeota archaeon]